jgi:hypothetical protein
VLDVLPQLGQHLVLQGALPKPCFTLSPQALFLSLGKPIRCCNLSVCICLCLDLSLSLPASVSLDVCLCLCLSRCLGLGFCLCLDLSISLSLFLRLPLSVSAFCVSVLVSASASVSVPVLSFSLLLCVCLSQSLKNKKYCVASHLEVGLRGNVSGEKNNDNVTAADRCVPCLNLDGIRVVCPRAAGKGESTL